MRLALRKAHQRYLFMNSKQNKSDAFQAAIQLLVVTTREIYMRTQAVCAKDYNRNIYENTGSVCKTPKC